MQFRSHYNVKVSTKIANSVRTIYFKETIDMRILYVRIFKIIGIPMHMGWYIFDFNERRQRPLDVILKLRERKVI